MDSSPEGPIGSPDPATKYVQNVTAVEQLQDLGIDPDAFGGLFEDVADIQPVDPDIPRIWDPPPRQVAPPVRSPTTTGVGTSTRQTPPAPPEDLIQQAMDEADVDITTAPITTGPGTTTRQPPIRPPTTSRSRAKRPLRSRSRRRATATTMTTSRSAGARRRRNRQPTATTTTAPARGRMQQQLRLLLDDIAADNREISNIVTTNTVTTTYKQNKRRPTVTNARTGFGNNRRNRPTVSRTSTRVTP